MRFISNLLFLLLISIFSISGQNSEPELVGHVLDKVSKKGISGVRVQLLSEADPIYTDSSGKFVFRSKEGFTVGRGYSFILYKEGYMVSTPTDNIILGKFGVLSNLFMKREFDKYLWVTVKDAFSGDFLKNIQIEINGQIVITNERGRAKFDFSQLEMRKIKAFLSAECYKDAAIELDTKGEEEILLTRICEIKSKIKQELNQNQAADLLDRVLDSRNGSKQGQIKAIEVLAKNYYDFNSVTFDGVNLEGLLLNKVNLSNSTFDYAELNNANLNECLLNKTGWHFATANNAKLSSVSASESRGGFMVARNTDFSSTDLSFSFFIGCDFTGSDFSGTDLTNSTFAFCNFTDAKFDNAKLVNTSIAGSILDGATFNKTFIENTDVRGTVAEDKKFNLTEEQENGLCAHVWNYSKSSIIYPTLEFSFSLIQQTPTAYFRSGVSNEVIVKEYAYFTNLGGGNCSICDNEKWYSGGKRESYGSFRTWVKKEVIEKNNRHEFSRQRVKAQLNLLKEKLIEPNTYRYEKNFEDWNNWLIEYFKKKQFDDIPIFELDAIAAKILQDNALIENKIPWKLLTFKHAKEAFYKTWSENGSNQDELPPVFMVADIPVEWVNSYKDFIIRESKRIFPIYNVPLKIYTRVSQNILTFELRARSRTGEGHNKDFLSAMQTDNINPDLVRPYRPNNSDYFTKNNYPIGMGFLLNENNKKYEFKVPDDYDKSKTEIGMLVKIGKLKFIDSSPQSYFIYPIEIDQFNYRVKGTTDWEIFFEN